MNRFKAKLEPVPHGGLFVVVPTRVAAKADLVHGARVRGTLNGVAYRSSLMTYSGVFHLGNRKLRWRLGRSPGRHHHRTRR